MTKGFETNVEMIVFAKRWFENEAASKGRFASTLRRVVVTGMGLVTPFGTFVNSEGLDELMKGTSAVKRLTKEDLPEIDRVFLDAFSSQVVATVPRNELEACSWRPKIDHRIALPFVDFAETATAEALNNAGWNRESFKAWRTGVSIGVGMSGTQEVASNWNLVSTKSLRKMSPFFVAKILPNMASGNISVRYGFQGPNLCSSTACAAGAHAIGDAFQLIRNGQADVMIAGGSESCIDLSAFGGFGRMKALSTKFNENPSEASRPFDRDRDGFVIGEGAGIVILESLEHAESRNAKIYAEICGYGMSGDGHHITHPHPSGMGAVLAMRAAIELAQVSPKDVVYINAHATSTPVGDAIELEAIRHVFGEAVQETPRTFVSSTKGAIGHLLGAAGAVEAVFTILTVFERKAPPTVNLVHPELSFVSTHILKESRPIQETQFVALSNSFGFGGTNACLAISTYQKDLQK